MHKLTLTAIVAMALAVGVQASAQDASGYWAGVLNDRIHILVHVTATADGRHEGTIENTDNESGPLPFSAIDIHGNHLRLAADKIGGSYDGNWDAHEQAWVGSWTMQGQTLPLVLKHTAAPSTASKRMARPQDEAIAKGPLPYLQENVVFPNDAAHVTLGGTLTKPKGAGPFPAVVLISGTGANTRDEVSAGHKIFLVLADALTRKGIAVLRYDKRGVGESTGDFGSATTADFASDAKAAVEWLSKRSDIDHAHIGVMGHSEGGVIAPMVAVADRNVAFVVMLAGPGVRGDKLFVEQAYGVALASGTPAAYVAKRRAFDQKLYSAVVDANTHDQEVDRVKAVIDSGLAEKVIEPKEAESLPGDVMRPWMEQFLKLDPAIALKQVTVPVLALNGSLDLAVPAKLNLPAIRQALSGNRDATVIEVAGLNHLFQTAKTGAPSEFAHIEETVAPSALSMITDWVVCHTHAP
ncbi:alpha/beta hydrolase family protein [Dyella acidisoli]|uniref:Alpha/beta hydrolase n=1 Tax=Dyella acidisoli TaxID=1867834 RepID=A0ABQ5XTM2_9GAMM|nr:alpha/beta fold hydrolase [Dyella acidisoli]GLQ95035.1 alpha/beta hydrolase [Dyella acidisoli]